MPFEWDETKRAANIAKHGLDLIAGALLFDGRAVVTYPSPRGGEERFVSVGVLTDELVALVWTRRDDSVRLISLRRARDGEKAAYRARVG